MRSFIRFLKSKISGFILTKSADREAEERHVAVPQQVDLPLPSNPMEEVAVPASIDGRDMANGRL
ncbi:hypothetical protein J2857_005238 [Neorhizobium galegae]|uniref:hypothetical protein n=1 Tax=Neorhizobium galegae TaxID=399 RepID=UPI001AEB312C|nr:hypothetical protein [Neorhizobium galegae]MBP2562447.1 hypothetical protein [Neorhizobium galegae]